MGLAEKIKDLAGYDEEYDEMEEYEKESSYKAKESFQAVLVKPERFKDATEIVDHLNSSHIVLLNLESASKDVSCRLLDFLGGAAYSRHGLLSKVAEKMYVITPNNVEMSGKDLNEFNL